LGQAVPARDSALRLAKEAKAAECQELGRVGAAWEQQEMGQAVLTRAQGLAQLLGGWLAVREAGASRLALARGQKEELARGTALASVLVAARGQGPRKGWGTRRV
jgi:hypothetical protein